MPTRLIDRLIHVRQLIGHIEDVRTANIRPIRIVLDLQITIITPFVRKAGTTTSLEAFVEYGKRCVGRGRRRDVCREILPGFFQGKDVNAGGEFADRFERADQRLGMDERYD